MCFTTRLPIMGHRFSLPIPSLPSRAQERSLADVHAQQLVALFMRIMSLIRQISPFPFASSLTIQAQLCQTSKSPTYITLCQEPFSSHPVHPSAPNPVPASVVEMPMTQTVTSTTTHPTLGSLILCSPSSMSMKQD